MNLPIRLRLTLAYAASAALVVAALGALVYTLVRADLGQTTDLGLRSRAQTVVDAIAVGGVGAPGRGTLADRDEAFTQVIDADGRVLAASDPAADLPPVLGPASLRDLTGPRFAEVSVPTIDSAPLRLLAVPATALGRPVTVIVGTTLGDRQDALHTLLVALEVGSPLAVAATALIAWFVAGRGLRPVEVLRREAAAISSSDIAHRLPVPPTNDEISRLATTLNGLLDRLESTVGGQLRFVDDASHELRTPLAVLKMELDLALSRPRDVVELTVALRAAAAETDRLSALAEDLLTVARQQGGRLPARREWTDLSEVVTAAVDGCRPVAAERSVALAVDSAPGPVHLDAGLLRRAITNLVDNAVRATPAGGAVTVSATHRDGEVRVAVADTGPGFPDGFIDTAFAPFTRADPTGGDGAGLGLAIVAGIVAAHRGTVTATNTADGAVVTMVLR